MLYSTSKTILFFYCNVASKGTFTMENDILISQRMQGWGDKGNGLLVALEKEMDSDGIQEEVALLFSE